MIQSISPLGPSMYPSMLVAKTARSLRIAGILARKGKISSEYAVHEKNYPIIQTRFSFDSVKNITMTIKQANVTANIRDMDRSISFYQSIGLAVKNRWGNYYA